MKKILIKKSSSKFKFYQFRVILKDFNIKMNRLYMYKDKKPLHLKILILLYLNTNHKNY
jgi:hypothetical protein